jgi:hypothetical protein
MREHGTSANADWPAKNKATISAASWVILLINTVRSMAGHKAAGCDANHDMKELGAVPVSNPQSGWIT